MNRVERFELLELLNLEPSNDPKGLNLLNRLNVLSYVNRSKGLDGLVIRVGLRLQLERKQREKLVNAQARSQISVQQVRVRL